MQETQKPVYNGWYKNRVCNPVVPLTTYRRLSIDCRVHKVRLKALEKAYFKGCDCPIWLSRSTSTEQFPRQATGLRDWAAEAKLRAIGASSEDETVHGPKLDDCIVNEGRTSGRLRATKPEVVVRHAPMQRDLMDDQCMLLVGLTDGAATAQGLRTIFEKYVSHYPVRAR